MIVVVGRVRTDAEKRRRLVEVAEKLAAASRQEAGCIAYRVYQSTDDEDEFVFVEEWESDDALQSHFRTAHIAEFMASAPSTLVAAPDVKFHDVAGTRDLSDVSAG